MTDDDALDLSGWEPPPLPADFADAVIARAREATNVALTPPPRVRRWRTALSAGVAVAGVVVGIVVLELMDRGSAPTEPPRVTEGPPPSPALPAGDDRPATGLSSSEIDRVIADHADEFRRCHQVQGGGTIVISFDIAGDGRVLGARVARTTVQELPTRYFSHDCIRDRVAQLVFPARGGLTHVEYPFVFAGVAGQRLPSQPAPCDARKLADDARQAFAAVQYRAALGQLEASLRCKDDPSLYPLVYLAACRAGVGSKVAKYYPRVAQIASLAPKCRQNHVDPQTGEPLDLPADRGRLKVHSVPPAKLQLDGVDTGEETPAVLVVPPGKHKVTLVVGDDRYTYAVTIKAGESTELSKQLE